METNAKPAEPNDDNSSPVVRQIIGAAEIEFAETGFDGAGMTAIAKRAGVSKSLLHYHFGSKEKLYECVIRSRSKKINDMRLSLLAWVDFSRRDALYQVLDALFRPTLGPEGGGKAYARIFAGLIAGHQRDQALVREYYDPTAHAFLDAIERAVPDAQRAQAGMIYQFALGALVSVISRDGRIERLMGRDGDLMETDPLIDALVSFVVGGAQAIVCKR